MQLISVLPPNSLSKVGRVLADCDVAPYPQDQIDKAAAEFREEALRNDPSSAPKKNLGDEGIHSYQQDKKKGPPSSSDVPAIRSAPSAFAAGKVAGNGGL